jgi:hypothetical protein
MTKNGYISSSMHIGNNMSNEIISTHNPKVVGSNPAAATKTQTA